jgi:hypothetical protein
MGIHHSRLEDNISTEKPRQDGINLMRTPSSASRRAKQQVTGTGTTPQRRPSSGRRSNSGSSVCSTREQEEKWGELPAGILLPEKPVEDSRPATMALTATFWPIRSPSTTIIHPEGNKHSAFKSVESLPPPQGDRKQNPSPPNVGNRQFSVPVRCPPPRRRTASSHIALSPETADTEYLAKLYDLRTWNMYRLITENRQKRKIVYDQEGEEDTGGVFIDAEDDSPPGASQSSSSSSSETSSSSDCSDMIFSFEDL